MNWKSGWWGGSWF